MAYPTSARGGRITNVRQSLLRDLVAYWPMNEASGDALDLHVGYTFTDVGGVSADTGKVYGTARAFDGAAQYLSRTPATGLEMGDTDWTMAIWFLATEFSLPSPYENHLLVSGRGTPGGGAVMGVNTSKQLFSFWFSASGGSIEVHYSTSALVLDTWYLAGLSWDATASIGGLRLNSGAWQTAAEGGTAHTANTNKPITIGATPESTFLWTGSLGPACYWHRILDENDWSDLWNSGAGLPYTSFTE